MSRGIPDKNLPLGFKVKRNLVQEQLEIIARRTVEIVPKEELADKLKRSLTRRKPLIVKAGFDPSAPDIHLGHVVILKKMREFQELGHKIVFVVGSFTGMIGDPSGQSEMRKALTEEEVARNAETYRSQVTKILDPNQTEFAYNHDWIGKLTPQQMIELSAKYTVARMLERDDFHIRFQKGHAIGIHELFYPLLQGYDSVILKSDIELGGTDQKFNLLVGRELQRAYGQEPQVTVMMPLLEGTDGIRKMSKSLNNYIGITETSSQMFGKVMSLSDDLMFRYYELLTNRSPEEVQRLRQDVASGKEHPKEAKVKLAKEIVAEFHGSASAAQAHDEFERIFSEEGLPDDIPNVVIPTEGPKIWICKLLVQAGCASSTSDASRLIQQGAVTIDGQKIRDKNAEIACAAKGAEKAPGKKLLLRVGKRQFRSIQFQSK
ncbi:MAG: tyrosine--tRNA ligase [Deltaproteobacteria bacterium]|nr:tyrosine--tRNA ligase [Deltaproteobacteria bacterium]